MKNQKGQLSIFLGISLLIVITLMGFIVNVGLFVKAKINLQNAVDAAAFAGAAAQARQLTNIGYLNWEMRNNYKEWMYKYYVLGQLGLPSLRTQADGGLTHFRLSPFNLNPAQDPELFDAYNLPNICIHFGSESNICEIYQLPGLPRFDNVDVPVLGVADHHKAYINEIVAEKARDCSTRSSLNQGTAMIWAYGTGNSVITDVPAVAGGRPGAWVNAIELAIRIRNLEAVVNRPPVRGPICLGGSGCTPVSNLQNDSEILPLNERPVKAFMSAYRNLGGGQFKEESGELGDPFPQSFKLTEIPPTPFEPGQNKLSTFLINQAFEYPEGGNATTKHYVDLQALPLNLATFFSTLISQTEDAQIPDEIDEEYIAEGACAGTRTALPVPGYIFGFVKNPEILTYYAVKGEANFVGLFYPFADRAGITLQAYAAAKPFGGRIGPHLFEVNQNANIKSRKNNLQYRSAPYLSGLEAPGTFKRGLPIPATQDFWIQNSDQLLGGVPTDPSNNPRFSIPNLLYDYKNFEADLEDQAINPDGNTGIQTVSIVNSKAAALNNQSGESLGLYDSTQYNMLRDTSNINDIIDQSSISAEKIELAILRARQPTKLEALNYLIPHVDKQSPDTDDANLEQPSVVKPLGPPRTAAEDIYDYQIYAPLAGEGTLYPTGPSGITATLASYITANEPSIDKYLDALKEVAEQMTDVSTDPDDEDFTQSDYSQAAEVIYRPSDLTDPASACTDGKQVSMAGKFHIFFKTGAGSEICGLASLVTSVTKYFNDRFSNEEGYKTHYSSTYAANPALTNSQLMTGFMPGPLQGAGDNAELLNPYTTRTNQLLARRNNYSTKFVPLASVARGPCNQEPFSYCYSYYERDRTGRNPVDFTEDRNVRNYVQEDIVREFAPYNF